ncbi:MAG: LPS export ABC transporter periplasmic protein LptC [Gammaproteobacteria bacterium]|nr:LPS export ABC transporter periplasmic protein LptC [Gammaproteobacteria bacterium]
MLFFLDKQVVTILFLVLMVSVSGWLALQGKSKDEVKIHKNPLPTLILKNVVVTQMNSEGHPDHQLYATEMNIFRNPNRTVAIKPYFTAFDPKEHWSLRAESGEMSGKGLEESITLRQEVKATYLNEKNQKKATLETSELTFLPKQQILKTDKQVLFRQGASNLQARGLYAKLNTKEVQLLGEVRGQYGVR